MQRYRRLGMRAAPDRCVSCNTHAAKNRNLLNPLTMCQGRHIPGPSNSSCAFTAALAFEGGNDSRSNHKQGLPSERHATTTTSCSRMLEIIDCVAKSVSVSTSFESAARHPGSLALLARHTCAVPHRSVRGGESSSKATANFNVEMTLLAYRRANISVLGALFPPLARRPSPSRPYSSCSPCQRLRGHMRLGEPKNR